MHMFVYCDVVFMCTSLYLYVHHVRVACVCSMFMCPCLCMVLVLMLMLCSCVDLDAHDVMLPMSMLHVRCPGAVGGYIAGDRDMIEYLRVVCAGSVYSWSFHQHVNRSEQGGHADDMHDAMMQCSQQGNM